VLDSADGMKPHARFIAARLNRRLKRLAEAAHSSDPSVLFRSEGMEAAAEAGFAKLLSTVLIQRVILGNSLGLRPFTTHRMMEANRLLPTARKASQPIGEIHFTALSPRESWAQSAIAGQKRTWARGKFIYGGGPPHRQRRLPRPAPCSRSPPPRGGKKNPPPPGGACHHSVSPPKVGINPPGTLPLRDIGACTFFFQLPA